MRKPIALIGVLLLVLSAHAQSTGGQGVPGGPSAGGGVTSLNTLTGGLTLAGGSNISITPSGGNTLTIATSGGGTVTSVGLTVPSWLTVAGSPVTTSGTLAVSPTAAQTSHQVIGTCGTGTTFSPCALVVGDLPAPYNAALPGVSGQLLSNNSGSFGVATTTNVNNAIGGNNGIMINGDSKAGGTGSTPTPSATQPAINGYPQIVSQAVGGPLTNTGVSGDQCPDQNYHKVFSMENPMGSGYDPVFLDEYGTNDATQYAGTANKQNIFNRCDLAVKAFQSIPRFNVSGTKIKIFGQEGTLGGGFAADTAATNLQVGLGAIATTNGATASYSVPTVAGGGLCFGYRIADGTGGTFTVAINGVNQIDPFSASTTWVGNGDGGATILTINGTTSTVAGACFASPGAGTQTVLFVVTSATSASNPVEVYFVAGTPLASVANPVVIAQSPEQQNNANDSLTTTYAGFVSANVATMAGFGMNVYYANTRAALLNVATAIQIPQTLTTTTYSPAGWVADNGVFYQGRPLRALTLVGSSPAQGQYSVSAGTYTINAADENVPLRFAFTENCGGNVEATMFTNCWTDLIHQNNLGYAVEAAVDLAAMPALKVAGLTQPTSSNITQGIPQIVSTSPSQFFKVNPTNQSSSTSWNPGIEWIGDSTNPIFTSYQGLTGLTTMGISSSAALASWCAVSSNSGGGPPIIPALQNCSLYVTGNGISVFSPTGSTGITNTLYVQGGFVAMGNQASTWAVASSLTDDFANSYVTSSTAATGGANSNSPNWFWRGHYFNVSSLTDDLGFNLVLGSGTTPTATLTAQRVGANTGVASIDLTNWTGGIKTPAISTSTNCSSSASPAVCGSAAAGGVSIPTGVKPTLVVNDSRVTAASNIILTPDDSLSGLGTCNSTLATLVGGMAITARTPGTSFTISYNGTITANGLCVSFVFTN